MKKFAFALLAAASVVVTTADTASARHPFASGNAPSGFFPFGFYQPYGAQFTSRIPTPPYFSVVPPVYYGGRYARPYGMSPFAAPPMAERPAGYRGRLRSQFEDGPHATPEPISNPYICKSSAPPTPVTKGEVRFNPFVDDASERLAKR